MERTQARSPASSRLFTRRFAAWLDRGLSARAASAAASAACDTPEEIATLGRAYFERLRNLGPKSLAQLAAIADGHLRHDRGTVRLTYDAIVGLRDLLDQIEEPLEDRQPALPAFWAAAKLPGSARYRRRVA